MKRAYAKKSKAAVAIIGGSDGPTSVFVAGKQNGGRKNPLRRFRDRNRKRQYMKRKARAAREITPNPHTPDELAAYITEKYHAVELAWDTARVKEGFRSMKASIVRREQPELLERQGLIAPEKKQPDFADENAVREWLAYAKEYEERAASFAAPLVPMDYHIYEIRSGISGSVQVELEKERGLLNVSFGSSKEEGRRMQEICRDIYLYYGVSREDIENETERYLLLLTELAAWR